MAKSDSDGGSSRDLLVAELQALVQEHDAGAVDAIMGGHAASILDDLGQVVSARESGQLDVEALHVLIAIHWRRFLAERVERDLSRCMELSEQLLWVAPHLVPEMIRIILTTVFEDMATPNDQLAADLNDEGASLFSAFGTTGDMQCLDFAIQKFRTTVTAASRQDWELPRYLSNLVAALRARDQQIGRRSDLEEAVAVCRKTLSSHAGRAQERRQMLFTLIDTLWYRYERLGDRVDLDEAISIGRLAIESTPLEHPGRALKLSNLAAALLMRYVRYGEAADLDEAIVAGRDSLSAASPSNPNRFAIAVNLSSALRYGYTHYERMGDLNELVVVEREAIANCPSDDSNRPTLLLNHGIHLLNRYEEHGRRSEDLDDAIAFLGDAERTIPASDASRPLSLESLFLARRLRYEQERAAGDLDGLIVVGRELLGCQPPDHPPRLKSLVTLAAALYSRYEQDGKQADLYEAISVGRKAVALDQGSDAERLTALSDLGVALLELFEHDGQSTDLDEAIDTARRALLLASEGHVARPLILSNLGHALRSRYRLTGQQADLDEAVRAGREAIALVPAGHPFRPVFQSNLVLALRARFEHSGVLADLDDAVTIGREAVSIISSDHPQRLACLSNLGIALNSRYRTRKQSDDLDEAIAVLREVVDAISLDSPLRVKPLSNLGVALLERHEQGARLADLDEAVISLRDAVWLTLADHPWRTQRLFNLGLALHARYKRSHEQSDLKDAIAANREAAGVVTAALEPRLSAARSWGRLAMEAGDPEAGLEGYLLAVRNLLPRVAWHGLDRATRAYQLGLATGLASEAAVCAVTCGKPHTAVELLEWGRSVLWTQVLALRGGRSKLAMQAPDLAAALERARSVLDEGTFSHHFSEASADLLEGDPTIDLVSAALERRRQAAREWDETVSAVRQLKGFEDFLQPPSFADLRVAGAEGPVVIVNAAPQGCHALIVRHQECVESSVQIVDLPNLTYSDVLDHGAWLLTACVLVADPSLPWDVRDDGRHAVFRTLSWAWDVITQPILAALGISETPQGPVEEWPRLWWCPVGPLTLLPLHAAGRHPRNEFQRDSLRDEAAAPETVLDMVVSSYTPSLGTLIRARSYVCSRTIRQLFVGVHGSPGQAPLPAVLDELEALVSHIPESVGATHLIGSAATRSAVLKSLPSYSWLHLSCHGVQDLLDASKSAFLMYDEQITLADLSALELTGVEVANLAACQTATPNLQLSDESLHLAGVLQLIGYRHVLAALWSISDSAAPVMADSVYAYLMKDAAPDAKAAGVALHQAVAKLREACPGEPLLWAPYVHFGP